MGSSVTPYMQTGELDTVSNLGGGTGIFASVILRDIQLKSITVTGGVSISSTATEINITSAPFLDEDNFASDSDTSVASQQSIKVFIGTEIAAAIVGGMTFKGDYDANTNTPDLDTTPAGIIQGDTYVTNVAGLFFTVPLEVGDRLMAKQDNPTLESHWSIVERNLDGAVTAGAAITNTAIVIGDGGAQGVKTTGVLIDGSDNISGIVNITLSGTVDGIDIATDVAANTAKVTNANHTGEVTGSGVLTAHPTMISNKTLVLAVATDMILIEDATDGTLKRVDAGDFISGGGDVTAASIIADHAIVRGDGGAKGVQDSGVIIDDTDNITGVNDITIGGNVKLSQVTNTISSTADTSSLFIGGGNGVGIANGAILGLNGASNNGRAELYAANVVGGEIRLITGAGITRLTVEDGGDVVIVNALTINGELIPAGGAGLASVQIGLAAVADGADSVVIGDGATDGTNIDGVAVGKDSSLLGISSVAIGNIADAGFRGVAVGQGALATADRSVAIGHGATATSGVNSVAVGDQALAAGSSSVAFGKSAQSNNTNGIALGGSSTVDGDNSVCIGFGSFVSAADTVAVGRGATVAHTKSIAFGRDATSTKTNQFIMGSVAHPVNEFLSVNAAGLIFDTSGNGITFPDTMTLSKGADVASAAALPLISDGNYADVTGTAAITSLDSLGVGTFYWLHFDAVLTLTHNATDLVLPTGANITTAAGDEALFFEYAAGDWRCLVYTRADGTALVGGGGGINNIVEDVTPQLGANLDRNGFNIVGTGDLELIKFVETGSAVNEITVTNAATAGDPNISATGGDTNITLAFFGKGTGGVDFPGGGNSSIKIGKAASTSGNNSTVIGVSAAAGVHVDAVVIGQAASVTGANSVNIGKSAAGAASSVAIGMTAQAADSSVMIGRLITNAAADSVGIGMQVNVAHSESIAIGKLALTTKTNQMVIGSSTAEIDELRILTTGTFTIDSLGNTAIKLGDAAGVDEFRVIDSADAVMMVLDSNGEMAIEGSLKIGDSGTGEKNITRKVATSSLVIAGGNTPTSGGNLQMYGASHASNAGDFNLRTGTTNIVQYDHSATSLFTEYIVCDEKNSESATFTAAINKATLLADGAGDYTANLPTAVGVGQQRILLIAVAGLTDIVTVDGNGTQTMGGALTIQMIADDVLLLESDNVNWRIIYHKAVCELVASSTSGQVVTASSEKLDYATEVTDLYQAWDGSELVAPWDGIYNIHALASDAGNGLWSVMIYVNGSEIIRGPTGVGVAHGTNYGSASVNLKRSDTLSVRVTVNLTRNTTASQNTILITGVPNG